MLIAVPADTSAGETFAALTRQTPPFFVAVPAPCGAR
jgi:hypothetical protein